MTKQQVVAQFKSEFGPMVRMFKNDTVALNEMFFAFADSLVREGVLTQSQWQRWSNPF